MEQIGRCRAAGHLGDQHRAVGRLARRGPGRFRFPVQPDFILTSERDIFRPTERGWEPYGDWNARCARPMRIFSIRATSILAEVVDFVGAKNQSPRYLRGRRNGGFDPTSEEEMDRVTEFIDRAQANAAEVSLSAEHDLSALLPRRLSQRRGLGGTVSATEIPQSDFRRRRSSQRHLDARWPLRRFSRLSRPTRSRK